jgi:hypothetical protein
MLRKNKLPPTKNVIFKKEQSIFLSQMINILDNGMEVNLKDMEFILGQMEIVTKVIGKKVREMVLERLVILMGINMKVILLKIVFKVKENTFIQAETLMKEIIKMIKNMGLAHIFGQMEINILVNLNKESYMAKGSILIQVEVFMTGIL